MNNISADGRTLHGHSNWARNGGQLDIILSWCRIVAYPLANSMSKLDTKAEWNSIAGQIAQVNICWKRSLRIQCVSVPLTPAISSTCLTSVSPLLLQQDHRISLSSLTDSKQQQGLSQHGRDRKGSQISRFKKPLIYKRTTTQFTTKAWSYTQFRARLLTHLGMKFDEQCYSTRVLLYPTLSDILRHS